MLPESVSLHSMTCRCVTVIFITFTVLVLVTVDLTLASQDERKVVAGRREKRNANGQSSRGATNDQLFRIINQYENNLGSADLMLYTPTTPSPEDVNCQVEIPVTQRVGGRCVNLGSFVGCQAGIYLNLDPLCEGRIEGAQQQSSGPMRRASHYRRGGYLSSLRRRNRAARSSARP